MASLQRHLEAARSRLALAAGVRALGPCAVAGAAVATAAVLSGKLVGLGVPDWRIGAGVLVGGALVGAGVWAALRRPAADRAAVALDEALGTKDRFSTALAVSDSADPFARAAVADAERLAAGVTGRGVGGALPLRWPRQALSTAAVLAVLAAGGQWLLPQWDLLGRTARAGETARKVEAETAARSQVEKAVEQLKAAERTLGDAPEIAAERKELEDYEDELKTRIMSFMESRDVLSAVDGSVLATWKSAKGSKKFDATAFKEAYPQMYDQFVREVPGSRRFLIK
jgi:hypothetical protein